MNTYCRSIHGLGPLPLPAAPVRIPGFCLAATSRYDPSHFSCKARPRHTQRDSRPTPRHGRRCPTPSLCSTIRCPVRGLSPPGTSLHASFRLEKLRKQARFSAFWRETPHLSRAGVVLDGAFANTAGAFVRDPRSLRHACHLAGCPVALAGPPWRGRDGTAEPRAQPLGCLTPDPQAPPSRAHCAWLRTGQRTRWDRGVRGARQRLV